MQCTFHNDRQISNRDDKKPQIILHYNRTKCAVDKFDRAIANYTCKRKSKRWPTIVFSNILDVSVYNAYCLFTEINPTWQQNVTHKRRLFIEKLGELLVKPYIERRHNLPKAKTVKDIVIRIQNEAKPQLSLAQETGKKRGRCYLCEKTDNKSTNIGTVSKRYVCKMHLSVMCTKCKICLG